MLNETIKEQILKSNLPHVGDKRTNDQGYVFIFTDDLKWEPEHRVVMERRLNRKLVKGESVHHINGVRDDNSDGNLELWIGSPRYGQRAKDIKCPHCGELYLKV